VISFPLCREVRYKICSVIDLLAITPMVLMTFAIMKQTGFFLHRRRKLSNQINIDTLKRYMFLLNLPNFFKLSYKTFYLF
jgi:hypothetical protein